MLHQTHASKCPLKSQADTKRPPTDISINIRKTDTRWGYRTVTYFISPAAFERYLRISAVARRAYHPSELPAYLKHAVRVARMDPRHGPLNAILDDE